MSPRKRQCPYREEIVQLLRIFGALLTPRQRACLYAHHVEGKGLSDIARELQISRQAILDTIRHGEKNLLAISACLAAAGISLSSAHAGSQVRDALELLEDLRERVAREGIIYSPRWIVEELERIAHILLTNPDHPYGATPQPQSSEFDDARRAS